MSVRRKAKTDLAQARTDATYTRTSLADERTYRAWVCPGLAAVATGLALITLMRLEGPFWLIRAVGMLFKGCICSTSSSRKSLWINERRIWKRR